ncbi:MAG: DNA primase [Nevskiales bacterium]|nr:DNA primase [Nevskiales bacterium]
MAGRIPDAFIHDLLARTDIVELIGARVELKRAGKELKGLSPFTAEKSPSFFVSPAKQMFFDFSSGKNGNAIGFLMEYERLSFVEAVEELARRHGLEVPREGGGHEHRVVMDGPLDALAAAQRFFAEQLRKSPTAIDYLKKRGVSGETARQFGVGYAPDSWNALTGFLQQTRHAIDAGLLIEKEPGQAGTRVYDRFRNRVMFPIRDPRGRVIGFGGRTLGNDPAKYLNSPETALFHKGRNLYGLYEARLASTAAALPYLIVVEGYMDVVMLAEHGIREAVATLGTATTRDHLQLIFKSTRKIVFCFDGDRAGRAAAWRALDQILPELYEDRECVFMFLPEGHDPDSLVQEIGEAAFRELIGKAIPVTDYLVEQLAREVDLTTYAGRGKLVELARPHLARLREGPVLASTLERLHRLSGISHDQFQRSVADVAALPPTARMHDEGSGPPQTRAVRRAMRLLLEHPRLADTVHNVQLLLEAGLPGCDVLVEALDFFQERPGASAAHLMAAWQGTKKGEAIGRLAAEALPPLEDEDLAREFGQVMSHLSERGLRRRVQYLMAQARERDLTESEMREAEAITRQLATRSTAGGG